jgi:hypothetical protein
VKQQNSRRIGRPGFTIKDVEPIDLNMFVKRRVFGGSGRLGIGHYFVSP